MRNTQRKKIAAALILIVLAGAAGGVYYFRDQFSGLMGPASETEPGIAVPETAAPIESPEPEKEAEEKEEDLPAEIQRPAAATLAGVPFVSQAPFGDWADPRQQHGCEEASLLMVHAYLEGEELTAESALTGIFALSAFEEENFGGAHDLSLADTRELWRAYYGRADGAVTYGITAEDIKREIAAGHPVVVPMDGTKLHNPHYTSPGPERHELVVIGYDDATGEFVTNDPGTQYGAGYRYPYDTFMQAVRDYKTGLDEPLTEVVKAMLVVGAK